MSGGPKNMELHHTDITVDGSPIACINIDHKGPSMIKKMKTRNQGSASDGAGDVTTKDGNIRKAMRLPIPGFLGDEDVLYHSNIMQTRYRGGCSLYLGW